MDANLIKYPVQTMFESMEVTINPHFMPINLEPFAIFACIQFCSPSREVISTGMNIRIKQVVFPRNIFPFTTGGFYKLTA